MNKRLLLLIIMMGFILISSGCSRNMPKAAPPQDSAAQPQLNTAANSDDTPTVSIGPPIQESYDPNQSPINTQMVYVTTDSGLNYHRPGCKNLLNGKIALGLDEAKEEGYTPCPLCNPPQ